MAEIERERRSKETRYRIGAAEEVAGRMEDKQDEAALSPAAMVFWNDKGQKRPAEECSTEDGGDCSRSDSSYCPPVKRERTLSVNQKSRSQFDEKTGGFRLKPPTLIHGQAPSAGVPSQKLKEQHYRVLRPAVLQAPVSAMQAHTGVNSGMNGANRSSETAAVSRGNTENHVCGADKKHASRECKRRSESQRGRGGKVERKESLLEFVFGENVKDRVKVVDRSKMWDGEDRGVSAEAPSGETNYFLQYISTSRSQSTAPGLDRPAKFVFGQNMWDRVLSPPAEGSTEVLGPISSQACPPECSTEKDSSAAQRAAQESLEASAAAYTKATARHCLLEKVEVITGEEAESNVLQIQCKLFVFDKLSQSWVERGRGLLRLNDMASTEKGSLQSRLVMRTQGSLRLILNTKLWAQMQTERAGEKSLRITAMDTEDQGLKVFLITASSKDTGQLYAALHHRILALRNCLEKDCEVLGEVLEAGSSLPLGHASQSNEDDSDEEAAVSHAPAATTTGCGPDAAETGPSSSGASEGATGQNSDSS